MRVLHLDTGAEMRGGQWQALRLVEGLLTRGVDSTLLARPDSPLFKAARAAGCHVKPVGFAAVARLARRSSLVHAHDARGHTLAALAGGAPLIVSRRVAFGPPEGRDSLISKWKYGRPAMYLAVSEFVKAMLMARGVPAAKIAVVYDGVPLLPAGPRLTPLRVIAPATDDPEKGAALALEGARLAGVELIVSRDLARDLPGASIFVYITRNEGLGSAVLLAMSAGAAVVASKVGGLPEIVRHGKTGLLVEHTPAAIAAAIRGLASDPALAAGWGEAGRRAVAERFTVEKMVGRTMELYRQVLS